MLAFNLHFDDVRLNIVMTSLSTNIESWANISERIMLFTNRGSDPIESSDPDGIKVNSILKFLQDIFCSAETSTFFYTSGESYLLSCFRFIFYLFKIVIFWWKYFFETFWTLTLILLNEQNIYFYSKISLCIPIGTKPSINMTS